MQLRCSWSRTIHSLSVLFTTVKIRVDSKISIMSIRPESQCLVIGESDEDDGDDCKDENSDDDDDTTSTQPFIIGTFIIPLAL